jgi:hypothetical protein
VSVNTKIFKCNINSLAIHPALTHKLAHELEPDFSARWRTLRSPPHAFDNSFR